MRFLFQDLSSSLDRWQFVPWYNNEISSKRLQWVSFGVVLGRQSRNQKNERQNSNVSAFVLTNCALHKWNQIRSAAVSVCANAFKRWTILFVLSMAFGWKLKLLRFIRWTLCCFDFEFSSEFSSWRNHGPVTQITHQVYETHNINRCCFVASEKNASHTKSSAKYLKT